MNNMYNAFINSGEIFLNVFNISVMASWLVLAVVIARLCLKKAPKWINCVLWALVGIRLIFPFNFESVFSLIPSSETIPVSGVYSETVGSAQNIVPQVDSGFYTVDSAIEPIIDTPMPQPVLHNNLSVIACIWICGIIIMMLYVLVSYFKVKKSVAEAMHTKENIYFVDGISTPFILGVIKPKIYIPSSLSEEDVLYVIEHEKAHLKRLDYLWKPFSFLLLSFYWFNPVIWVAYIFLCKDIELACDEKAIKEMDSECRKEYSNALINCSSQRRLISACPLAFGETSVKSRIKSVLNYKKPAFWIIIIAVIACVAIAVAFLTSPLKEKNSDKNTPDTTQGTKEESTTSSTVADGVTVPHKNNSEELTDSATKPVEDTTKPQGSTKPQGATNSPVTTQSQSQNSEEDYVYDHNRNGVIERGERVDFQQSLPESVLLYGKPEYELNCDDVVSAEIITNYLYDELEGIRKEYTKTVTDKNKIKAFEENFNALLATSEPDKNDTWWLDDDSGDEYIIIYFYKADGSYIKVTTQSPWRIRLEDNDRRMVSPYDRKVLLDSLYDKDEFNMKWWSQATVYKVDMEDDEFIEKAKTVTKEYDWFDFKSVFGKTGDFEVDDGFDRSIITNGEYILIVDEGYQAYLRKFSDPDYRLQID